MHVFGGDNCSYIEHSMTFMGNQKITMFCVISSFFEGGLGFISKFIEIDYCTGEMGCGRDLNKGIL